jgi:hypothetical protein
MGSISGIFGVLGSLPSDCYPRKSAVKSRVGLDQLVVDPEAGAGVEVVELDWLDSVADEAVVSDLASDFASGLLSVFLSDFESDDAASPAVLLFGA